MRLPRPHIPIEVRCRVVLRQLGEMWPERVIEENRRQLSSFLVVLRARLAVLLDCNVRDLRLDHDPALGAREKIRRNGVIVGYRPHANDPEHLIYREKHAHHIKTNVHGDGAQHPDRVLIKRERRREQKKTRVKRKHIWQSRPMQSAKKEWPSRSMRGNLRKEKI